jgi:hypothetical protein
MKVAHHHLTFFILLKLIIDYTLSYKESNSLNPAISVFDSPNNASELVDGFEALLENSLLLAYQQTHHLKLLKKIPKELLM